MTVVLASLMTFADVPKAGNRPGAKTGTTNTNKKPSGNTGGKKTGTGKKTETGKKTDPGKKTGTGGKKADTPNTNKSSNKKKSTGNVTFKANGVSFTMIYIEGGTFMMGDDVDGYKDEEPVHSVTLSSFLIGETEVTQELWTAVMNNNPSYSSHIGSQKPVNKVSWNDCQEFIRRLNSLTGEQFRLPTEAEWEYAARGGNKSRHFTYSGSDNADDVAWYKGNSDEQLQEVKKKKPNELGIYDMSGNAMEWCQDWYGETYYSSSPSVDPKGPSYGDQRVYRDGAFFHSMEWSVRPGNRSHDTEDYTLSGLTLRLAMTKAKGGSAATTTAPAATVALSATQNSNLPAGESKTYTAGGVSFKMIKVQGGTFQMGPVDSDGGSQERPVHNVTLSTFMIGETEVTQELWEAVMGSNPSVKSNIGPRKPVVSIDWNDCQVFIQRLNAMTGQHFRLPTEAEWEYAARGGNKTHNYKFSGSDYPDEVAWYLNNSDNTLHNVKTKKANELGIYDMSGNAMEWCQDWYDENYYSVSPVNNPKGPSSGTERVYRDGGYFHSLPWAIRCARRDHGTVTYDHPGLTLRLAM